MRFGIHVPRQASLPATARYAADIGCETIQLFSGNPMGWGTGKLEDRERVGFIDEIARAGIGPVVLHKPQGSIQINALLVLVLLKSLILLWIQIFLNWRRLNFHSL